jgi:hypothetical protein
MYTHPVLDLDCSNLNYCRKCAKKQNWKERTIIGMTKE